MFTLSYKYNSMPAPILHRESGTTVGHEFTQLPHKGVVMVVKYFHLYILFHQIYSPSVSQCHLSTRGDI